MPTDSRSLLLLATCWLTLAGPVVADVLSFVHGGQVECPVVDHPQTVDLILPWGHFSFPRGAFRRVILAESLSSTWRQREAKAEQSGTASARFEAAWWALEQGLTAEAILMFRVANATPGASKHAPLVRVGRLLDHLDACLPTREEHVVDSLLAGSGWSRLEGRHVVLIHQGGSADAAERLSVLDRVVETYYLSLAAQGLELPLPENKLVSIWFARQADYISTLRRIDAAPFANTQGFYHPGFKVVFAFDTRSIPDQAVPRRDLQERRLNSCQSTDQWVEIDRQMLLLDIRWRGIDLGIAAHETVHQLVAASRLAAHADDWPNWLHEGFSAQFEVVRNGRWAGIGHSNDNRLPDWRSIQHAPQLAPLLRDIGLSHGYNRDRYAEAWSLVYFLRKTRPTEFVTFLQLLQAPHFPGPNQTSQAAFESAFDANIMSLQIDWRRFMNQLTLPIDGTYNRQPVRNVSGVTKFAGSRPSALAGSGN